ncbi:MAG: AMP-binding protein [Pseudomonadota bacterium]
MAEQGLNEDLQLQSPLQIFYRREQQQADDTCFVQPYPDGRVEELSWQQVGQQARCIAAYLKSLDYPAGSNIAILSGNCAHWIIADLAIWMAGHVSVPLYPVLSAHSVQQILEHSEAKLLFVGKIMDWNSMSSGVPEGVSIVTMPIHPAELSEKQSWQSILNNTDSLLGEQDRDLDDLATIVYTSGTTGMPKGVMHSFRNIAAVGTLTATMYETGPADRMLSYLPLAHVAERAAVETNQLYRGFKVYFANSLETFGDDLKRARPTLFFAVPRIWLKLQQRVHEQVPAEKLQRLLSIPILSRVIRRKISAAMGLDKVRIGVSGAAPLSTSILAWYARLNVPILEGYAMSENFAYSHTSRFGESVFGTVGKANPMVQCKISDVGEVLVKTPTTMLGYYKEPEITAQTIDKDGYIHTGDKGRFDEAGNLVLTGRIKEIFKTSKGKYVAPAPIEDRLLRSFDVEQVCVTGADLPQPLALLTLSEEATAKLQQQGSGEQSRELLTRELQQILSDTNQQIDKHENLQCLVVLSEPWTVENGLMTPTLKIKREQVEALYRDSFESWSSQGEKVIWI